MKNGCTRFLALLRVVFFYFSPKIFSTIASIGFSISCNISNDISHSSQFSIGFSIFFRKNRPVHNIFRLCILHMFYNFFLYFSLLFSLL